MGFSKTKIYIIGLLIIGSIALFASFLSIIHQANAQAILSNMKDSLDKSSQLIGYSADQNNLPVYIGTIFQAFIGFFITLFFAQTIWAGYLYITSRGNEQTIERAKNMLTQGIIGTAIAVSAFLITYYVTKNLSESAGYNYTDPTSAVPLEIIKCKIFG